MFCIIIKRFLEHYESVIDLSDEDMYSDGYYD